MKHLLTAASLAALLAASAATHADPAAFVGLTYHFGGKVGITAKVLSSDEEDKAVAAVGGTYWIGADKPFGLDVSAGYTFDNAAALVGYDFLQKQPSFSAGWADVNKSSALRTGFGTGGGA